MQLKKPLLIGSGLFVTGALIMGFSYGQANLNVTWQRQGPKLIKIRQQHQVFKQGDQIKHLVVDAQQETIKIQTGAEWAVDKVSIDGRQASASQKGATLTVKAPKGNVNDHFLFAFDRQGVGDDDDNVVITVPKNYRLANLTLKTTDGGIRVNDLTAQATTVLSQDGGVAFDNFAGDHLEGQTADGRLRLDNVTLKTLTVKGRDSSVYGKHLALQTASAIDLRDGRVDLDQVQAPGYNLQASADGHVSLNQGSDYNGHHDGADNDADYEVHVDGKTKAHQITQGDANQALSILVRDGEVKVNQLGHGKEED